MNCLRNISIAFAVLIVSNFGDSCINSQRILYISFLGDAYSMNYIKSEKFCLLYNSNRYSESVLIELISKLDTIYSYLIWLTEYEPQNSDFVFKDYTSIAIVKKSCSISCGYLGKKGIEIEEDFFYKIYNDFLHSSCINCVLIYELGRNFWPLINNNYTNLDLPMKNILHTSYAVFLRLVIIKNFKLDFCNINEIEAVLHVDYILGFINKYKKDKNKNLSDMLLNNNSEFIYGKISKSDLLAGFLFDVYSRSNFNIENVKSFIKEFNNIKNINNRNFFKLLYIIMQESFGEEFVTDVSKNWRWDK